MATIRLIFVSLAAMTASLINPVARAQVEDTAEANDRFGSAVAIGDFNGDSFPDAVFGVPAENLGTVADAGAVSVIYGTSSGLASAGDQFWTEDNAGAPGGVSEAGDGFGAALAVGDFNGDGYDDLAVGAPTEDVGAIADAGAVTVLYGSPSGVSQDNAAEFNQDTPGVPGEAELGDLFAAALVSGDFNGDGYSDLAIGIRQDNVAGLGTGGGVAVLYGSTLGLETDSANEFNQDTPGVPDEGETGDDFGAALAAGDFNGDTFADLAIGAPGESLNNIANAGAVTVLYGSPSGLSQDEVDQWTQNSPGILDRAEVGDKFGAALAASYCRIPCSGISDTLIVGVPFENVGTIADAGAIAVLYGSIDGLTAAGNQFLHQNSAGILDKVESGDRFGAALSAIIDSQGEPIVVVGVPDEDVGTIMDAGAVAVLYSEGGIISATGNQFWHQNSPGVPDTPEASDHFGAAVSAGVWDDDWLAPLAAPRENVGAISDAGAVNVLYSAGGVLTGTGSQFWHQNSP